MEFDFDEASGLAKPTIVEENRVAWSICNGGELFENDLMNERYTNEMLPFLR